jgi:uncharacterized membrane protein
LLLCLAGLVALATANGGMSWQAKGLLAFALIGVVLGISFAEYVVWSAVGGRELAGMLPRYYLPLLPFALLLTGEKLRVQAREWMVAGLLGVYLLVVFTVPWLAARRFYNAEPVAVVETAVK